MRPFPAGIAVRRASGADMAPMLVILDEGIAGYTSFAPEGWTPPTASEETKELLASRFDAEAWGLLAFAAGDEPAGLVSLAEVVRADAHRAPRGTGYIWHMFVRPHWQGTGLAGALMDRALEEAPARGYERLVLWTPRDQAQARRFYEREGFTLSGREQFNEEIGLDLVQYERPGTR